MKHCYFSFPKVSFTDGVSAGEGEIFSEQIRAQLQFYRATVLEGLYFSLPGMLISTVNIVLLNLLQRWCQFWLCFYRMWKKPTWTLAIDLYQRKYQFQLHVLPEDALQHPQQPFRDAESVRMYRVPRAEGYSKKGVGTTWAKPSAAVLAFLFSLGPKTNSSWLGESRTPPGYLPYLFLLFGR